jgi:hypothetical protein
LRFTAVFQDRRCFAVAGWRIIANTSTLRAAGCHVLDLDSTAQRHAAHRFYLRDQMDIVSHHFAQRLS